MTPDCNRCATQQCQGKKEPKKTCTRWLPPKEGWQLAELALAYPTSLNEALRQLPFETNLDFYLK